VSVRDLLQKTGRLFKRKENKKYRLRKIRICHYHSYLLFFFFYFTRKEMYLIAGRKFARKK